MKKYVIGDIHGSYNELRNLLQRINPDLRHDKIIFLGDYIDRGPASNKVVELLINLQNKFGKDHVTLIRGNHEQMAIDNIKEGYNSSAQYLEFFQSLPLYFEDEHFIYVHGGIRPGVDMENQVEDDLLWIREEFYNSSMTLDKPVIFGHTPTQYLTGSWAPFIKKDRIGIDTGCVFGGHLTALEILDGKVVNIHQENELAA